MSRFDSIVEGLEGYRTIDDVVKQNLADMKRDDLENIILSIRQGLVMSGDDYVVDNAIQDYKAKRPRGMNSLLRKSKRIATGPDRVATQ